VAVATLEAPVIERSPRPWNGSRVRRHAQLPEVKRCKRLDESVAAKLFQPLAVMVFDPHRGVQAEPVDVGAQGLARRALARHRATHSQHLLPGSIVMRHHG